MSFLRKQESRRKNWIPHQVRNDRKRRNRNGLKKELKGILSINNGILELKDKSRAEKVMDELIYEAVFTEDKDRQIHFFF